MKKLLPLLLFLSVLMLSCKKTSVDASSTKAFQLSVNDMASGLATIDQIKFNEALFVLKTFGVEGKDDTTRMKNLANMLAGKKVSEILSMADQIAQKNGIEWSSVAPPSLGEMKIFNDDEAEESDPNDIPASSLSLMTKDAQSDSISGPKALQIIPRLVDNADQPIEFTGAALETVLEVYNNGVKLSTAKNLMQDNHFKGFTLRYASLSSEKIIDNKIDITVTVKTTKKTYKMSKIGVLVNPKALSVPKTDTAEPAELGAVENQTTSTETTNSSEVKPKTTDPKAAVSKFLNQLNNQNLKAAFDGSENPAWGSYENFSNPNTGFGSVKTVVTKVVNTKTSDANSASVNAVYDVTDKNGKTTSLQVTFGLKNVNGEWKISSYKIN